MSINPLNSSISSNSFSQKSAAGQEDQSVERNRTSSNQVSKSSDSKQANPISQLPESRPEVVASAKEKLSNGFYQSKETALETAKSILR